MNVFVLVSEYWNSLDDFSSTTVEKVSTNRETLKNYAKEKVKNFKRSKYDGIMIDDNETEFKLQFRGNSYSESDSTDYTITYEIKEVEQI